MGKFQLNKKGEDPIKIYEDTFKVANSTVETHLGKLGKMPNPIAREYSIHDRNNPNRDLSDPDWVSVGASRIEKGRKNTGNRRPWWNNESKASEAPHTIAEPDSTPQGDNYPTYYYEMSRYPYFCKKCGETLASHYSYIQSMIDHLTEDHGITELSVEQTWNESKASEAYAEDIWDKLDDEQRHRVLDATNFSLKEFDSPLFALRSGIIASSSSELQDDSYESWSELADTIDGLYGSLFESKAKEVNGKYIINGMVIGKVTDFEPNNWFGKVELSEMPEFAEYGNLDPQAVVKGDDGVTYTDPKGGSDGSRGTLFNADGSPKPPTVSWGEVEAIAKEAIDENEKDEMFQYLFDLQESGITNMFGSGPYVEREFPHLDKKEVRDVVMEWMSNYEAIHARMGIESRANEKSIKQACKNAGVSLSRAEQVAEMNGMDLQAVVDAGNLEEMLEDQRQDDDWYEREARAEFGNESSAGRFLETPQLQQIRNHWDNVMPEEEKRSMLEGMAFLYKSNPTQKFDDLNWEVKESVALSVARLAGVSIDMGTLYGQQYLDDLRSMSWD